jgi:hypothetical protein
MLQYFLNHISVLYTGNDLHFAATQHEQLEGAAGRYCLVGADVGDASLLGAAPITIDFLPASGLLVFPGALQTIRKRSVPIVDFISIDLSPMRFQWVNIDPSRYTVTDSGSGNCVTRQLVSFPLSAEVAA